MSNYAISLKRTSLLLAALAFTALLLVVNFASFFSSASASQLTSRSLTLSSTLDNSNTTGAAGTELNGSAATHTLNFTVPSSTTVGSILVQYCTDAVGSCTAPTGMDLAPASLGGSTTIAGTPTQDVSTDLSGLTGQFAGCTGTNGETNCFGITTSDAAQNGARVIQLTSVVNPTYDSSPTNPDDNTFFVRVYTFDTTSYTTLVDDGTVASAITEGIVITSRVAESLGFSTSGALTNGAGGDTDPGVSCAPLTGSGAITIGDPTANTLSLATTYDNYSGFRVYTNAANATLIQYEGDTLRRNGSVDIDPIGGSLLASAPGTEQFGLAIDLVNGGTASVPIASSTTDRDLTYYEAESGSPGDGDIDGGAGAGGITVEANYLDGAGTITNGGTASFAFVGDADVSTTPQTIAQGSGFITCATAAVRYIANISPTTPAGTYTTTIVYSAVPTY